MRVFFFQFAFSGKVSETIIFQILSELQQCFLKTYDTVFKVLNFLKLYQTLFRNLLVKSKTFWNQGYVLTLKLL